MLKKKYLKTRPVCKVTFSLPLAAADGAEDVKLLGDFNNWSWEEGISMKRGKEDYQATVELAVGRRYEFRYLADGVIWLNDHEADAYVPSPFHGIDNSVVVIEGAPAAPAEKKKRVSKKKPAAKKAKVDNLKKIEGIGPKIEQLLKAAGISTFEALAKAKKKTLRDVLTEAGPRYKMHDPSTWSKQASLAAKGQWDKLQEWQDELKGGRAKK